MSSFQHPQDGPTPLCGPSSIPNNPTFFAFTAWCTDLTLECSFSNCTANNGVIGVQIAIYDDCDFSNAVACNVAPADCNTDNKILSMTGLNIGDVYYFLIDGCLGAYCDVSIDIIGTCGEETISPWTLPITGEINACAGNIESYIVEDLDGAATYHWYIDGTLSNSTSTNTNDISWTTPGNYQLCIDASNDPCVLESDDPLPICTTISVYGSEAGTLTINPTTLCPSEIANLSVSGQSTGPDNAQMILITDLSGVIIDIINASTGTFTSPDCDVFMVYSYNYIPAIGTIPVIGQNVNNIDCVAECCDLKTQNLSFEDVESPIFNNLPDDLTLDCTDLIPPMVDQEWTDNCDGNGMVVGNETGSVDGCFGGSLSRTWTYTDQCNNSVSHTQNITVNPTPVTTFINPPADITVDCNLSLIHI